MIVVLAGTSEGREAAALLQEAGWPVLATVTSELGTELLNRQGIRNIRQGRLSPEELWSLLVENGVRFLVDATHPFARVISRQAMEAAGRAGVAYLRLERDAGTIPDHPDVITITRLEEAEAHVKPGMTVFSALGSKHLPDLMPLIERKKARLIARVLPLDTVMRDCARMGLNPDQIVAARGPFTREENLALFKEHKADLIISKASGPTGGMEEKITAALELGIPIILWTRPAMECRHVVHSPAELLEYIEAQMRRES
jgi:precorrin-6A/cobalt-precorrin-6A reductase